MCAVFQPPPELVGKVFPEREADSHVPACLQRRFARPPFQPDGVSFPFLRSLFAIDRLIKIFLLLPSGSPIIAGQEVEFRMEGA